MIQVRNHFLAMFRQFRLLQNRAEHFWKGVDNSYFASPEVYAVREAALREALVKIGPVERALDVGCGDGRFTLVLREVAQHVCGYDISELLIAKARERAASVDGVAFLVAELEEVPTEPPSQVVACLGVTSCVVDEEKFRRVLERLTQATVVGGYLIMIDTLSTADDSMRAYRSGYVGKYRSQTRYERELGNCGMTLIDRRHLAEIGENLQNCMFVFQRTS